MSEKLPDRKLVLDKTLHHPMHLQSTLQERHTSKRAVLALPIDEIVMLRPDELEDPLDLLFFYFMKYPNGANSHTLAANIVQH